MPFLTIAGITIEVVEDGAEETEATSGGEVSRAFDGTWLSTTDPEFRVRQFNSYRMTEAAYQSLRAAIAAAGGLPAVGGEAMGFADATTVTAFVRITRAPFVWLPDGTHERQVSVRIEE